MKLLKVKFLSISIYKKNENVDQQSYKVFEMCSTKYTYKLTVQFHESQALLLFLFYIFVRRYSRTNKGSKKPPYNLKPPKESLTFQRSFQPFEFNLRKCMFIFEGGSKKQLRNGSFFTLVAFNASLEQLLIVVMKVKSNVSSTNM